MKVNHREKSPLKSGWRVVMSLVLLGSIFSGNVAANPIGPSVVAGGAAVSGVGTNQVTINQTTPQAILHWQQFNIAPNEVTRFIQPSAQSIALNRIFDANPSQILGSLQANGHIILLNPNGVLFGPGAQVNVNGLIASSLDLKNEDFLNGRYRFGIDGGSALRGSVTNQGTIEAGTGGVYLFAPNVSNNGIIRSPEGQILLAAGATVYLSQKPDGNGFLWEVSNTTGEAANLGSLIADGGRIGLSGRTVRQAGLIQANSIREKNGRIELIAAEQVSIEKGSRTLAKGDTSGISPGGTVIALSDKKTGTTQFEEGAQIDVSGAGAGGDGGFVELSGGAVILGGVVRGLAQPGFRGGRFLLDPYDLDVDENLLLQLSSTILFQDITLQADHDITVVSSPLTIYLSNLSTNGFTERTLNFVAGNDLRFNPNLFFNPSDVSGIKWNIKGSAGNDIIFSGARFWLGNGGGFEFSAGRDILLQAEVVQGTKYSSFLWTMDGGDIKLKSGRDIVAPTTFDTVDTTGMYSGIRLAGDSENLGASPISHLTIEAGRDFLGGFTLANGTAKISTGGQFGRSSDLDPQNPYNSSPDFSYANLNLGSGTIQIDSKEDIYLGRVQDLGLAEAGQSILDPKNAVILTAQTGDIHLNPIQDIRLGVGSTNFSSYYTPSFTAHAEAGSIFIENKLAFWPSLTGSLDFFALHNIQGTIAGGSPVSVGLLNSDPESIQNQSAANIFSALAPNDPNLFRFTVPVHPPASVRFQTQDGDISTVQFVFKTVLNKEVTIFSGRDLKQFIVHLMSPEGTEAVVHAERNIEMNLFQDTTRNPPAAVPSGIYFYGTENGTGRGTVYAGGNLDLGDSNGIQQQLAFGIGRVPSGLIDISVGGDLRMTTSMIYTYNGASISIHGIGGPESPMGGLVDVGTNSSQGSSTKLDRGIATVGGGSIDILATGDVNVNASRVATLGGGDIRITSTKGNINAGIGGINDTVLVFVPDPTGKPTQRPVSVPGSGIFTFHDADPSPLPAYPPVPSLVLPPPPAKTAEMSRLEREMIKQSVLGHNISSLRSAFQVELDKLDKVYQAEVVKAVEAAAQQYEEIKAEHRKDWQLGDIELTAKEGAVVVPPAGIRGRKITIDAKTLDLQGGQVSGDLNLNVTNVTGGLGALSGPVTGSIGASTLTSVSIPSIPTGGSAGSAGLGGLNGSTGSISSASSSSVTTASTAVASVQEKVAEQTHTDEPSATTEQVANTSEESRTAQRTAQGQDNEKKPKKFRTLQIRRGVVIQVEVQEEQP